MNPTPRSLKFSDGKGGSCCVATEKQSTGHIQLAMRLVRRGMNCRSCAEFFGFPFPFRGNSCIMQGTPRRTEPMANNFLNPAFKRQPKVTGQYEQQPQG